MKAAILALALLSASPSVARENFRPALSGSPLEFHRVGAYQAQDIAVAMRFVGGGNPTGFRGPWCAAFVSLVLRSIGRPPLPNLMADSALAYGPHVAAPNPGDIAVMRGHVGFVVADHGARMEIVSGNWGKRVARATLPRWAFVAFIRV